MYRINSCLLVVSYGNTAACAFVQRAKMMEVVCIQPTYTHTHTHTHICIFSLTHTHTHIHKNIHIHIQIQIRGCEYHMCTHIQTQATNTHIYTHTHMQNTHYRVCSGRTRSVARWFWLLRWRRRCCCSRRFGWCRFLGLRCGMCGGGMRR